MNPLNYIFIMSFFQFVIISYKGCLCTISCFTCSSRNGSDIDCEDPFHPGPSSYTERCKVPKRGHIGEFPAHYCIKVTGLSANTHEKLVIRRCVLGNMENQCGKFRLENDTLHGCILTCDLDGCNSSVPVSSDGMLMVSLLVLTIMCASVFGNATTSAMFGQNVSAKRNPTRLSTKYISPSASSLLNVYNPSICDEFTKSQIINHTKLLFQGAPRAIPVQ